MSAKEKIKSFGFTQKNHVELIRGGKPYFDRLTEMINGALNFIHIQAYIFEDDYTGNLIGDALQAAVKRKVEVYLLVDGYASRLMSKKFIKTLRLAGIHLRFFDPILKTPHFYVGRRLHHKIAVADSHSALIGGVNIADRYNDMPGEPAWLDFAVYVQGEAANELNTICWKTWRNFPGNSVTPEYSVKLPSPELPCAEHCAVSVRRNDWVRRKNQISATYVGMLRNANSHIIILCSYFLPGRVFRQQLNYAASRGVNIKIITSGISDVRFAKQAERYMYRSMLNNNIELYEYRGRTLHGKIAVCDGNWLTVGSYNINNVSTYASIELNVVVRDQKLARESEKILQDIMEKDCERVTNESLLMTRNPFTQLARWFSYQFIRLGIYFFTFYFKHQS